jgi:D-alanine-D-alanine ligase
VDDQTLNILVLCGGRSTERDVSFSSAEAVIKALRDKGHEAAAIDIADGMNMLDSKGNFILPEKTDPDQKESPADTPGMLIPIARELEQAKGAFGKIDLVFNALHGGAGEDGTIQGFLDLLGVPYTGPGMTASAVAMNKDLSKRIMQSCNIPTADWLLFQPVSNYSPAKVSDDVIKGLGLPVIVKPTSGGSTVGLTLAENESELMSAIDQAGKVSDSIMAERYIRGREITIGVLDGTALPTVEIKPKHKLYDYTCKYTKGMSEYICPASLDDAIRAKLSVDAETFYKIIGCSGYARVDFIVRENGEYFCLELNTLPGMTDLSLLPMAAKEIGLSFADLVERICRLALEKRNREA